MLFSIPPQVFRLCRQFLEAGYFLGDFPPAFWTEVGVPLVFKCTALAGLLVGIGIPLRLQVSVHLNDHFLQFVSFAHVNHLGKIGLTFFHYAEDIGKRVLVDDILAVLPQVDAEQAVLGVGVLHAGVNPRL